MATYIYAIKHKHSFKENSQMSIHQTSVAHNSQHILDYNQEKIWQKAFSASLYLATNLAFFDLIWALGSWILK